MRLVLVGALAGNNPLAANPSDGEMLSFFKQLFSDASGASALSSAKTTAMAAAARGVLSGNFAGIANPNDADVVTFWGQLSTDSSSASALTAQRYLALRTVFRDRLSNNYPGASNPSEADVLSYFGPFAGVLGAVATRASVPEGTFGTATTFMNRTGHIARDAITSLQAAWANWYLANPGGYTAPAGTLTVTASVEYPAGTFTQLKWSGSASVVIASGTNPLSDATVIPGGIPSGATFWIRSFLAPSANIVFSDGHEKSLLIGDLCQNTGSSDMTMGGAITDNNSAVLFPVLILGQTAKRSCYLLGHSLVQGLADQCDTASGDNGDLERPLSPTYATTRSGTAGETVATFVANAGQRIGLAQYHTDIVVDFSANDLGGGATAAQIAASYASLAAFFPGKRLWLCTACPALVPSTDSYATLANQTVPANDPQRQILNANIRANGIAGYNGCIELSDFVEQARSGKWQVDGTAFKFTTDGTHQTAFANKLISITLPP